MGTKTAPRPLGLDKDNPMAIAERFMDEFRKVPWSVTVFVEFSFSNAKYKFRTYKPNDPDCERFRRSKLGVEVGTYNTRVSVHDLRDDLIAAMGLIEPEKRGQKKKAA